MAEGMIGKEKEWRNGMERRKEGRREGNKEPYRRMDEWKKMKEGGKEGRI
jgi:hypothetical protein